MSRAWVNSWRRWISCSNMILLRCLPVFPRELPCEMQIVFTCPAPLLSVGGSRSYRETVFSQARFDPFLLSQGSTEPFGQLSVLVIQAMGLCAGFAVADFKPICWRKIGLVYQPSFIVHILFVNPTNYIYFPIANCFFLFLTCFLSFAHTNT